VKGPGTLPGPSSLQPILREERIDILRGWALITILINHLSQVVEADGLTAWLIPTPTRYGYSTAAELFVVMSGYMVGLVYLARGSAARAVIRRAGTLWLYNLALLGLVLPLALFMSPAELSFWRLGPFLADPLQATFQFMTLQKAPRLLDILLLYVTLMLIAPVAIALHRRSPRLLLVASIVLYLAAQVLTIRHVSADPSHNDDGILKLMSWQLLFFGAMVLGAWCVHTPLLRWLDGNWPILALLLGVFAVGAVASANDVARPEWLTGRYGLNLLRLSHTILMLLLYASLLSVAGRFLQSAPLRSMALIGRHSLDCFAAGLLATYVLGLLWERLGGGLLLYYAAVLGGLAVTLVVANRRESRKKAVKHGY
jgi:hypothetical protein